MSSCISMVRSEKHLFSIIPLIEQSGLGGVFQFDAGGSAPAFWNLIQRKLESRGIRTDAVILDYSEYRISLLVYSHTLFIYFSTRPGWHVSCTAKASSTVNSASIYSRIRTSKYPASWRFRGWYINPSGFFAYPSSVRWCPEIDVNVSLRRRIHDVTLDKIS